MHCDEWIETPLSSQTQKKFLLWSRQFGKIKDMHFGSVSWCIRKFRLMCVTVKYVSYFRAVA